jgi:hypothetical protein
MEKVKIHLEYPLNGTSRNIIWGAISTPTGLEGWFADKVKPEGKFLTFHWGKTEARTAEIIASRSYSFIRLHWVDEPNLRNYFEIKMNYDELTDSYTLEITDFADPDDVDGLKELWNSEVEALCRNNGM